MDYGISSPLIAQGLLAPQKRIAAKISVSKLDETIIIWVWNVPECGKKKRLVRSHFLPAWISWRNHHQTIRKLAS